MPYGYQSTNPNIESTTRELWIRTVVPQVFCRTALLAFLLDRRRFNWRGGKNITLPVDMDEMDDLAQEYTPKTPLTGGSTTMLKNPYWLWKYFQVPVVYGIEEELENSGGEALAPVDFVKFLVKKAHRAARLKLNKMMYDKPSTTSDSDSGFQGVTDALKVSDSTNDSAYTYGHIARDYTGSAYKWWNPATLTGAGTATEQVAQAIPSLANFRKAVSQVQQYVENKADLAAFCGSTIFQDLASQIEARHIYNRNGQRMARFGFQTIEIDGVQIVEDVFLNTDPHGGTTANAAYDYTPEWFFLINAATWHYRFHPARNLKFTGFKWQGDVVGGLDQWLGRIMAAGNLTCDKPNGNFWGAYWKR